MARVGLMAFTAALAICAPTIGSAQSAFDTPPGSWRNSCRGGTVINGRLNALCDDSRGLPRNSYLEIATCQGREIINSNGNLTCAPSQDRPRQWTRPGGGGRSITAFEHTNYQGRSRTWAGEVVNLVPEGWNDIISSLSMRGSWEVCTDINFRGRCQVFDGDVVSTVPLGLNDVISSIRPVERRGPGGRASITVFQHVNHQGASRTYTGDVANLVPDRWNDVISSMTVRGAWEVCTDIDFRGRCEVIDADVANVIPLGLNDVISSMRPLSR